MRKLKRAAILLLSSGINYYILIFDVLFYEKPVLNMYQNNTTLVKIVTKIKYHSFNNIKNWIRGTDALISFATFNESSIKMLQHD